MFFKKIIRLLSIPSFLKSVIFLSIGLYQSLSFGIGVTSPIPLNTTDRPEEQGVTVNQQSGRPPNIIFIVTDDLGWGDPESYGNPYIKTPNLDRLAKQGTLFKQFYTNSPVCSPSRAAIMTGVYPARLGIHQQLGGEAQNKQRNQPNWLDADLMMITDLFKYAGYATAHFGKWHLGNGVRVPAAPLPSEYGIDVYRTSRTLGSTWDESKDPYFRAHSTGYFVDEALQFIENVGDQPFFVNLWTLVPHAPLKPTLEELARYTDIAIDADNFGYHMAKYVKQAPDKNYQAKNYFASVTGLDFALGRLFNALEQRGLSENTLVIFTSDNGPEHYHAKNAHNAGFGSPGPFRDRKRSLYEGGVRTPLIVSWPGHIPDNQVNEDAVITGVDFLPTLVSLAGFNISRLSLDGEDVSDILLGSTRTERKPIYWEWRGSVADGRKYFPPQLAIRQDNWKLLMRYDGTGTELYDILKDPGETENLIQKHPKVVQKLSTMVLAWKKKLSK